MKIDLWSSSSKSHFLGLFFIPRCHFLDFSVLVPKDCFPFWETEMLRALWFYTWLTDKHFNYTNYCKSNSFRINKRHKSLLCLWLKCLQIHINKFASVNICIEKKQFLKEVPFLLQLTKHIRNHMRVLILIPCQLKVIYSFRTNQYTMFRDF